MTEQETFNRLRRIPFHQILQIEPKEHLKTCTLNRQEFDNICKEFIRDWVAHNCVDTLGWTEADFCQAFGQKMQTIYDSMERDRR